MVRQLYRDFHLSCASIEGATAAATAAAVLLLCLRIFSQAAAAASWLLLLCRVVDCPLQDTNPQTKCASAAVQMLYCCRYCCSGVEATAPESEYAPLQSIYRCSPEPDV